MFICIVWYFVTTFEALGSVYHASKPRDLRLSIFSLVRSFTVFIPIILVIDGPISDDLESCIASISKIIDLRICRLEFNIGFGLALSHGMSFCKADYIIRFDTDDINNFNRFHVIEDLIANNPDVDIFSSVVTEFISSDAKFCESTPKNLPLTCGKIVKAMNYMNPINHPSVVFKRVSIESVGGYQDCK